MKQSILFTKTIKEAPKDETSKNAILLTRAGFIHKEMAGVYTFLPLGLKVLEKIKRIVVEEMDKINAQQVLLSSLQNKDIWEQSGRWSDEVVDVWFKSKVNGGGEVGFGPSHEEPLTTLLKKYINSYSDLPKSIYQIQTKFRNELRAKSGIMRTREFSMKDMYSFHTSDADLEDYYKIAIAAYHNVYNRVGLGDNTFYTVASGGMFVDGFSHEFQTLCETGEDIIYLDRNKKIAVNKEVYNDKTLSEFSLKKEDLEEVKASEVGNIFKLGVKYSKPLGLEYTDKDGVRKNPVMGCYGIGISRLMGVIVEVFNDDKGILWPDSVAPYQVHLVSLGKSEEVSTKSIEIYENLLRKNIEVLWDDRDISNGEKFADADLIGIPKRYIVSENTIAKNGVEVKLRKESGSKIIGYSDI